MARRPTLRDRIHGVPPDVAAFARLLTPRLTNRLLAMVWVAYDELRAGPFSQLDWDDEFEDLERSITEEFADEIENQMDATGGFLPLRFRHAPFERESRSSARAQPPEYDMAFFYIEDKRLLWPLEAKVLHSDTNTTANLGDYVETLNSRYLSCKYAPFAPSGVMLGYLKQGVAEVVLGHLAQRIGTELKPNPAFPERAHRTSSHLRSVPSGKPYPPRFLCHHLIMTLHTSD